MKYLVLLSSLCGVTLVSATCSWVVAVCLRVSVTGVRIGLIPVFKTTVGNTEFSIGLIPLGSSIGFADSRHEDVDLARFPHDLANRPLPVQLALDLSGVLALLVVSALILGSSAYGAVLSGFRQAVLGTLSFRTVAVSHVASAFSVAETKPWLVVFGLACAKVAALDLLPFPPTATGRVVLDLARVTRAGMKKLRVPMTLGAWLFLVCYGLWAYALVRYLTG